MMETIGKRIKEARWSATPTQAEIAMRDPGITQKELAKRVGCTAQYISNIENGTTPGMRTIAAIQKALKVRLVK